MDVTSVYLVSHLVCGEYHLPKPAAHESYRLTAKFIRATRLTRAKNSSVRATFGKVLFIRATIDKYLSCLIILATNELFA